VGSSPGARAHSRGGLCDRRRGAGRGRPGHRGADHARGGGGGRGGPVGPGVSALARAAARAGAAGTRGRRAPGLHLAAARQREGLRAVSRFEYHEPESLAEAIALAERHGAEASFLAGGTDLIVQIERGGMAPRHVVGLGRVPGLTGIEANGRIALGARVTHRAIERAAAFSGSLRGLVESAEVIGGHQVRNVGTVGGNLVNASPAADLVPCLLALDAAVTLVGPGGERELPVEGFLVAPNRTARRPDELLTRVSFSALPARAATAFLKAGRRRAMEISVVCVAARLTLDASLERCLDARVALGAVAPTALRAREAERALEGQPAGAETFRRAAEAAQQACRPIDDVRASAAFRRHLVGVLVRRALDRCVDRARAGC